MPRPLAEVEAPPWFRLAAYDAAHELDAADWFLNLMVRARGPSAPMLAHLRRSPLIRRADDWTFALLLDVAADLGPLPAVTPMRPLDLYFFERRLPAAVREFARGEAAAERAPPEYSEPLDRLFSPRMLAAFARIDLSMPDRVILADLREYLSQQRAELAAIPGPQPYAEALRKLGYRRPARLKRFGRLRVLAYIDVTKSLDGPVPDAALERMLGHLTRSELRQARTYSELLMDEFVLRGWLGPAARAALRARS